MNLWVQSLFPKVGVMWGGASFPFLFWFSWVPFLPASFPFFSHVCPLPLCLTLSVSSFCLLLLSPHICIYPCLSFSLTVLPCLSDSLFPLYHSCLPNSVSLFFWSSLSHVSPVCPLFQSHYPIIVSPPSLLVRFSLPLPFGLFFSPCPFVSLFIILSLLIHLSLCICLFLTICLFLSFCLCLALLFSLCSVLSLLLSLAPPCLLSCLCFCSPSMSLTLFFSLAHICYLFSFCH